MSDVLLRKFGCLCVQLIISVCLYQSETREERFQIPSLRFTLPFAVPAVMYCLTNNLGVHIQLQMDPASYQAWAVFIHQQIPHSQNEQLFAGAAVAGSFILSISGHVYVFLSSGSIGSNR